MPRFKVGDTAKFVSEQRNLMEFNGMRCRVLDVAHDPYGWGDDMYLVELEDDRILIRAFDDELREA